jgi:hypothetical protein
MWERANVPDSVIKVMINPAPAAATVVAGTSPILIDPNLPPPEVGAYWRSDIEVPFLSAYGCTEFNPI